MMETISHEAETLFNGATEYLETKTRLWKLKMVERAAEIYSKVISRLSFLIVMAIALLFLSGGLAIWLGERLGNTFYGFFIVGGIYLVAGLLIYTFRRNWIEIPSSNAFIKKLLK